MLTNKFFYTSETLKLLANKKTNFNDGSTARRCDKLPAMLSFR